MLGGLFPQSSHFKIIMLSKGIFLKISALCYQKSHFMKNIAQFLFLMLVGILITNACKPGTDKRSSGIESTVFGKLPDGQDVQLFTLHNAAGMEVKITNYGGAIVSWTAPDRDGNWENITLGCDSLSGYLNGTPFFGALIGRYGNRIAKGAFSLEGQDYVLAKNNIGNALHGGVKGFDKVLWSASILPGDQPVLQLDYLSKDGEEGYPGNLQVRVQYALLSDNALQIVYEATTDKTTVVNLTNHAYFNLSGAGKGNILNHELQLNCNHFLPVDSTLIPTGELRPVEGTVFDFRNPKKIGLEINDSSDQQIQFGLGYDHCWVASDSSNSLHLVAILSEPSSGRVMEVLTTEPAIQFYSGNFLNGTVNGIGGEPYGHRSGLCLETQHFPDSPNQPSFPSTVLRPGERYQSTTLYRFK
jgi:aldose 1-epimerase